MRKLALAAAIVLAAPVMATTASASSHVFYAIDADLSKITEVRRIGGNLIPEISAYSNTNPFLLDPQDPKTWPLMSATLGLWDPANPTALPPIVPNIASVGGRMDVIGGVVTEAEISQLGQLSLGTFQSATVISSMEVNGLVWTYNPVTGQLNHQQAPGDGGYAECVPAGPGFGGNDGTSTSGQCRQLAAAVNSSGVFGQSTIANSWLNWDGLPEGYTVHDNQNAPYHAGTGGSLLVGPQSAVEWDLTDFVEGVGGIIRARVVSGALSGNNGSAVSALYTLHVTLVPVPAAVWMFVSGLGLLAWVRRRTTVTA